jgi:hypothetical protein
MMFFAIDLRLSTINSLPTDTSAEGLRSAGGFDTADLKEAKALLEELKETGC